MLNRTPILGSRGGHFAIWRGIWPLFAHWIYWRFGPMICFSMNVNLLRLARRVGLGTALLTTAAGFFSGCSRAQSQTTTVATVAPANGTNADKAMNNFKKPPAAELTKKLTPMQYSVTQHAATEPAFRN